MAKNLIEEYQEYVNKTGKRLNLYRLIANTYHVRSALYPGSHIDIDPSIVISHVTYIDNFKGAIKFFKDLSVIEEYINTNKEYDESCEINFIPEDYSNPFTLDKVDLIISQYAGFVGQATKQYLKTGGILLCNDSHGDATLAKFDPDFELIGVINSSNKISTKNLDEYFHLNKDKPVDLDFVRTKMKGPKYKEIASNYIFKNK
jgi:hypothetical protein